MRILSLLLLFLSSVSQAQIWDKMCYEEYLPDTAETGALKAEVNAMGFFRDNEYDSNITQGYSLPGAWLQPKLTYQPLDAIKIEVGVHAMLFDGANKYPNYAYHDIATWKGSQYQRGLHVLPFFRARASLKHLTFVLGDLYGAQNHELIGPMFNPEQNLTTDPEMGLQMLLDRKRIHYDLWINWQSYIFKESTHQEAFTVGSNAKIKYNSSESRIQWSTPVQLLIQHRGGEQDATQLGVQTLCNGSVGVAMDYEGHRKSFPHLKASANILGSYQQAGQLWPFETGMAVHGAVALQLWKSLNIELGYVGAPKQFANLFGSPFFSTLSVKPNHEQPFNGMHTVYANVDYTYTFHRDYHLGAMAEVFSANTRNHHPLCFAFGVMLRVTPSFLIKRWR